MFLIKNVIFWRRKSCVLNNLRNLNKVFKNDVTCENINSHKKAGFHPLTLKNAFLEKPHGDGDQIGSRSLFSLTECKMKKKIFFVKSCRE